MSSWFIRRANVSAGGSSGPHGWVDMGIVPNNGGIIKYSDGTIVESSIRSWYAGYLEAGKYKITGFSVNSNYPCLATSTNGSSYSRVLTGTATGYVDNEQTFATDVYIRMNGSLSDTTYNISIKKWYD